MSTTCMPDADRHNKVKGHIMKAWYQQYQYLASSWDHQICVTPVSCHMSDN